MDPFDLSQTQRIVLLIDLHPLLLRLQNPNSYISSVLSASQKLLSFPPLSSSLFAYKLFFSSLSPILSTSKIHRLLGKSATFLSFDRPSQILDSLSQTLNPLSTFSDPEDAIRLTSPRAFLVATSLLELELDYAWESQAQDPKSALDTVTVHSNLVVLFSPLSRSLNCLSEYVDVDMGIEDKMVLTLDTFSKKFFQIFGSVNERFLARDIHVSWIDVDLDLQCAEERLGLGFLEKGIKELGWGLSSTDAIMLGSALVPFGLIFPYIGCTIRFGPTDTIAKGNVELVLEISDVSGKPLECKCCDLEVLDLKLPKDMLHMFRDHGSGSTKVRLRDVWRNDEGPKVKGSTRGLVLLRGFTEDCGKDKTGNSSEEFFADRVLESLCTEKGEFIVGKPVWQLLLAFLYKRCYWALVSVSDDNGNILEGILIPFTVHYAVLCIVDSNYSASCQLVFKSGNGLPELSDHLSHSNMICSSISASSKDIDDRKKRNKKHSNLLRDLTWSSFRESVFSQSDDIGPQMDLEEVYLTRECNSKKLRFLKCWMRQLKKGNGCCRIKQNENKVQVDVKEDAEKRILGSQQENELLFSCPVAGETYLTGSMNEEASASSFINDSEAFFGSIAQMIEQGLYSEEIDLGLLAKRLVGLSIRMFYAKFVSSTLEDPAPKEGEGASDVKVVAEVPKLLLKKPKDLALKYKGFSAVSLASDPSSTIYSTENKVREHELQILFRMEILHSKIGANIEENVRQKMIKEICSLLQNIEFNLQGGLFGGESLVEFAGRTIKSRYAHSLGNVIHKIYDQMEFFSLGGDDVEASESLPNSNNIDEPQRDENDDNRTHGDAIRGTVGTSTCQNTTSTAGASPRLQKNDARSQQCFMDRVQDKQLVKAQERRERARRFSSFTSWMPDLQRVWAPKPQRAERSVQKSLRKPPKRRKRVAANDMVCETPMMSKEPAHVQGDDGGTGTSVCNEINLCRPLSKALFHNSRDYGAGMIA